eukprot:196082-Rhodomonas_salina.2
MAPCSRRSATCGVQGVQGSHGPGGPGFMVQGLRRGGQSSPVRGTGFRVQGSGSSISCQGSRGPCSVEFSESGLWGPGSRVQGLGSRV